MKKGILKPIKEIKSKLKPKNSLVSSKKTIVIKHNPSISTAKKVYVTLINL